MTPNDDALRARVEQAQALAAAAPSGPLEWSIYAGRHPVRLCTESQFQADAGYLLQLDIDRIPRELAGLTDLLAAAPDLAALVADMWAEVERLTAERDAAAAKERAAVVAWLAESSGRVESMRNEFGPPTYSEVCHYFADAIEAGDHLEATRA